MAEREPAKKGAQKSAMSATPIDKGSKGFTAEERAAMRARARELRAEAREQEPGGRGTRRARGDRRDAGT